MFKLKITKKGVSPLIATILLVAVSLSLAGILYSWASQNASSTVTSVTSTQQQWAECSAINLYIESCNFDSGNGKISLILSDHSSVDIDSNLEITIIDINNQTKYASFAPNFKGGVMTIDNSVFPESETLDDLEEIQRVYVFVKRCPDRKATTISCDN